MPCTCSSAPAGMAGAGVAAAGSAIFFRTWATAVEPALIRRAPEPAIRAIDPAIIVNRRKPRRSMPGTARCGTRPVSRRSAATRQTARRRMPDRSTTIPTTAPITVGTPSIPVAPERVTTAITATSEATPKMTTPTGARRRSSQPASADPTRMRIPSSVSNAALSPVPNRAIMKSFAPGGARSITSEPTANSGLPALPVMSAQTSATPSTTAAATTPTTAAYQPWAREVISQDYGDRVRIGW